MNSKPNNLPPRNQVAELIREITDAQVVRAIDKKTGNASIVYGVAVLEAIANETIPAQRVACIDYSIDFSKSCDDIEFLVAAVQAAKGCHEYAG